ncbi:MAG: PEP-CTERM sorting domain-containing protein [Pirellulales bacterium]|nr:PEP-CTERM sorting domain-containing protein [Pirellulales bacterium]
MPLGMGAALLLGLGSIAQASHVYTITQSQSQLNLTVAGTVLGGALNVTEQQANAITRYNGTIVADFPGGPGATGSISFPGGSAAAAVNPTGLFSIPLQYSPNVNGGAGTAAANYGVNLNAPIGIALPPIDIPNVGTLNLGTLQSVNMALAVRNLVLDVDSTGALDISLAHTFDASGVSLSVNSGFTDLNGSLVFQQADLISHLAAVVALNALDLAFPDLNLTVSSNILQRTVSLGLGTRFDLTGAGALALPNTPATSGSVSYALPSGSSTLIIPVQATLPSLADLGIPEDILDLDLSLSGQLRATAIVPEPSTIVLAISGAVGLVLLARRRK